MNGLFATVSSILKLLWTYNEMRVHIRKHDPLYARYVQVTDLALQGVVILTTMETLLEKNHTCNYLPRFF